MKGLPREDEGPCLGAPHLPCHLTVPTVSLSPQPNSKNANIQRSLSQKVPATKAVAGLHLPLAAYSQAHQHWGSLLALPPYHVNTLPFSPPCQSPASKLQMPRDCSHFEGASNKSYSGPSSSLSSAFIGPATLRLRACLAT